MWFNLVLSIFTFEFWFWKKRTMYLYLYTKLDLVLDSSNREMHLFDNINMCVLVYVWTHAVHKLYWSDTSDKGERKHCYVKRTHTILKLMWATIIFILSVSQELLLEHTECILLRVKTKWWIVHQVQSDFYCKLGNKSLIYFIWESIQIFIETIF